MIIVYTIGGATLFFAAIFLLFVISSATNQFALSVVAFLETNNAVIFAVVALLALLSAIFLGRQRKITIPGLFVLFAQFGIGIFLGLASVVYDYADSPFLMIFSFVIYAMVVVIDLAVTVYLTTAAVYDGKYILLYCGAILGTVFQLTFW